MKKLYKHFIIWPTIIAILMTIWGILASIEVAPSPICVLATAIVVAVICGIFITPGFIDIFLEKYKK